MLIGNDDSGRKARGVLSDAREKCIACIATVGISDELLKRLILAQQSLDIVEMMREHEQIESGIEPLDV